jgi:hypothetical protein
MVLREKHERTEAKTFSSWTEVLEKLPAKTVKGL